MAAKSCDDPMDLGPFLQNYVMKNPFNESTLLATTTASTAACTAENAGLQSVKGPVYHNKNRKFDQPLRPLLPKKDDTVIVAAAGRSDKKPRTVAEMLRKARGDAVPPYRKRNRASADDGTSKQLYAKKSCVSTSSFPVGPVIKENGVAAPGVVTKRSIIMYSNPEEMMDKYGNSADADQTQIESWIRDNYRYLHGNRRLFVPTQHLLLRAQQYFPNVTGDLIEGIVKDVFPLCETIQKKNGNVYLGLVTRPEPDILDNPVFMAALESVITGMLSARCAAEKFGIRETSLVAAVAWTSLETHDVDASGPTEVPSMHVCAREGECVDECRQGEDADSSGNTRNSAAANTTFRSRRKRQVTKRSVNGIAAASEQPRQQQHAYKADDDDDDDSFDLEMMMLQDASGMAGSAQNTSTATADTPPFRERLLKESRVVSISPPSRSVPTSSSPSTFVAVEIKAEPDDDEDSPTEVLIHDEDDGDDRPLPRLPVSCRNGSSPHRLSGCLSAGRRIMQDLCERPSSSGSVTSGRSLGAVRQGRTESPERSVVDLQAELTTVRKANLALQEELSTRDFHLAQLAESFFQLHEQFRQLAQQFQQALRDVQLPGAEVNGYVSRSKTDH